MNKGEKPKKREIHRVRKRLSLTIDPDNHDYIKNNGLNASRLMDTTLNELRNKTNRELVFILENKDNSWARCDSNAGSSPCKGDVITS